MRKIRPNTKWHRAQTDRRGITVVELMIVATLTAVVMVPLGMLLVSLYRAQNQTLQAQEASMRASLALMQIEMILMDAESFEIGYKTGIPADASIRVRRQSGAIEGVFWNINPVDEYHLAVIHEQLTPPVGPPSPGTFPRIIADMEKRVRVSNFRLVRQQTADPDAAMFVQVFITVGFGDTGEDDSRELMTRIFLPNKY